MTRLAKQDDSALDEFKPLFDMAEAAMGYVPNALYTMAQWPELLQGFMGLAGTINRGGTLDPELRHMVSYMVSRSAGCLYCQSHTSHSAAQDGMSQQKLEAIWSYETSDLFTDAEKAALAVAQGAGHAPNQVTDEDFAALGQHFSDREIIEIVAVISLFGFLNRWNDTFATTLEDVPAAFAKTALAGDGWTRGDH